MSEPEIRADQLTGLPTILAPGRSDRPLDFHSSARKPGAEESCPFCEGREDSTPPEVWADRPGGGDPDTPGWRMRAVPNLYPALGGRDRDAGDPADGAAAADAGAAEPESTAVGSSLRDPLRASARGAEPDMFSARPAHGTHEVIVHCPEHRTSLGELDEGELSSVVAGWRERMAIHAPESSYVQLIVNEGGGAGASLEHTHAQLYALPFVPVLVARERERFTAYHERTMGGNLLADIASEEVRRSERLGAIDEDAMLICPWASRGAFELRLIPRRPAPSFERDGSDAAPMLATALRALREHFGAAPELNLWIRTAPRGADQFHWHLDIAPKLAHKAGFELSTGVDINIYPPERAAAELRAALG